MSAELWLQLVFAIVNAGVGVLAVALVGIMIAGAVIVGVLLSHSSAAARRHG